MVPNFVKTFLKTGSKKRVVQRSRESMSVRTWLEPLEDRRLLAVSLTGVPSWVEQGPGPIVNGQTEGLTYNPVTGAVEAIRQLERSRQLRLDQLGPDHPDTLNSMNNLATLYREMDRLDEAEPLFLNAVTGARRKLGLDHSLTQTYLRNLADCYDKLQQPEKAEPLWQELATFWKVKAGADSPQYAAELFPLGTSQLAQNKFAEAESILRECAAIRETKDPDAWTTFSTKSLLGASLLGQKKYAEAEPLLLASYNGISQRAAKMPPLAVEMQLRESLERLVQLYEATGDQDKAAEWRKKLDEQRTKENTHRS